MYYVKNTFRLLQIVRNSFTGTWSWRSEWIVQPDLPCCDLQPLSRVISPRRSEWSLSREPRRIMINFLAKTTRSLITTRHITFHTICINFQVVVFEITPENLGLLTQFVEKWSSYIFLLNQGRRIFKMELIHKRRCGSLFSYLFTVLGSLLPSSCTAFSQAFTVNWFRWRIWDERPGVA